MSRRREKVVLSGIVLALLSPLGVLLSCISRTATNDEIEKTEVTNSNYRDYPVLVDLVSKSHADTEWDKRISFSTFSTDVEAALKSGERPILLISRIDDIVNRDGVQVLRFKSPTRRQKIVFILKSDPEMVERVRRSSFLEKYAVVASISSVRTLYGEEPRERWFLAEGQCLELVALGQLERVRTQDEGPVEQGWGVKWLSGLGLLGALTILILSIRRRNLKHSRSTSESDSEFQRIVAEDRHNVRKFNAIEKPSREQVIEEVRRRERLLAKGRSNEPTATQ